MKLVVGLGNPGNRYRDTRHNVGFRVLDRLAVRWSADPPKKRFEGELSEIRVGDTRVLLLAPQTYMNRSGRSVLAARDYYKIESPDILIICDDFQLPIARLRARSKGSAGGQKGLDDVIRRLGHQEIPRLRIGVDEPPPGWEGADFVLSKFKRSEQDVIGPAIDRAAEAVEAWIKLGIDACMNEFNRDPN
jgi:PTH1 family peptidyl-tRNA hydrolase